MGNFKQLGVNKNFIKALSEINIKEPSPIQEASIPVLLDGPTDFVGLAPTGTGKTAAYGIPLLQQIDSYSQQIQAVILSPTRELVLQIKKQLFKFTKYNEPKIFVEAVYGGEKIDIQIKNLSRPTHIVVATPGRLVDLIKRKKIALKNVNLLVLDEADEMLSLGFKDELDFVLKTTQNQGRKWLFSATMPGAIQQIVKQYLSPKAPQISTIKKSVVNENITHQYVPVTRENKNDVLIQLLDYKKDKKGIVFTRTKKQAQQINELLQNEGFSIAALEGNMQQKEREKVMRAFKNDSLQFLISTDVAARGIDVKDLDFVLHYQLPDQVVYYTHRSGRTARAGKTGFSIALILPHEMPEMKEIAQKLNFSFKKLK
ncbi:DEAD/DEAH box helicase [Mesonia sediminis]|uniref:DEAD/DEAH box helicase n=1 Tax=Mesonia sediminis TaxID=1703946 RepID=A0ABW5SCD9_9FLAO